MTHREIVAIVATGLIVLVILGFAGAWWLIGYREAAGYDREHAAHKASRVSDAAGMMGGAPDSPVKARGGANSVSGMVMAPSPVPNLGKFVADEPSHVHQRRLEPLRSTGGYIPELADDSPGDAPCADDAPFCWPHETPALTFPGAGQDVIRPDSTASLGTRALEATPDHPYPALVAPPAAGAGPEPPGPARDSGPLGDDGDHAGSSPGVATGTGPGDLVALLPDDEAFLVIRWEFARLRKMAEQPYKLSEWRSAA